MPDTPFTIAFDDMLRRDLHRRLRAVRWSDAVTANWSQGTDKGFLQALMRHWLDAYDLDAAERRMNALPQFRASVDGYGIHYIRLPGVGPAPKPLLLMNGWPSSFVEYRRLAPMLADPAAFGGSAEGRVRGGDAGAARVRLLRPPDAAGAGLGRGRVPPADDPASRPRALPGFRDRHRRRGWRRAWR